MVELLKPTRYKFCEKVPAPPKDNLDFETSLQSSYQSKSCSDLTLDVCDTDLVAITNEELADEFNHSLVSKEAATELMESNLQFTSFTNSILNTSTDISAPSILYVFHRLLQQMSRKKP